MAMIAKLEFIRQFIVSSGGLQFSQRRIVMRRHAGVTLIELFLTIAVMGVIASIGVGQYQDYQYKIKIARVKSDIRKIDVLIARFYADNKNTFPAQLSNVGADTMRDPWGNAYVYCELASGTAKCKTRKDKSLHPLNSDYDLCSMGKDGKTNSPLTAAASRDDIIRARNGLFLDLASNF